MYQSSAGSHVAVLLGPSATLELSFRMSLSRHNGDRLAHNVVPKHYDLLIKSDLQSLTFSGMVRIKLDVKGPISSVVLHANKELELGQVFLLKNDPNSEECIVLKAKAVDRNHELEQITVDFKEQVITSDINPALCIEYRGQIRPSMSGYYRNSYIKNGKTEYFAMTQLQPTYARQAFPCFDEPALKASFTVAMIYRKDTVSISNTHVVKNYAVDGSMPSLEEFCFEGLQCNFSSSKDNEWTFTTFSTTPRMSTYLVAYANGNFKYIESSFVSPLTKETIPVRVYALDHFISDCKYVLDLTTTIIPIYEEKFDISYPLKKLDILVATDFEQGAMENWGLITGRAAFYVCDPKKSATVVKKNVCYVQCHEIAHQWFGNIVTMEFWDDLWLNESFATIMGDIIIPNIINPQWKPDSQFISFKHIMAAELDALRSSHPVEVHCNDSRLANQFFDRISYAKGSSVLRQLANHIGLDTFIRGVSLYLKKHLYGNAKTVDLWNGISEASGIDVAKIMDSWISKVGFPVVTVEETGNGLKLRQNRFLSTGDVKPEEDETLWCIPLEVKYVDEHGDVQIEHKHVLESREMFISMSQECRQTYKLNADTTGFYIVSYSLERWSKIGDEMAKLNGIFSANDKLGILNNLDFLCLSGYLKISTALELIAKMKTETEYVVIRDIISFLKGLKTKFYEYPEIIKAIDQLSCQLFVPLVEKLNFFEAGENDDEERHELRTAVLEQLAGAKYEPVLKEIRRRFSPLLEKDDRSLVPKEQMLTVLSAIMRNGGDAEYEKVLEIFDYPRTPHDSLYALIALSRADDERLIQKLLDAILKGKFRDQDFIYLFRALGENNWRRKVWRFFKENFAFIKKKFEGKTMFGMLISATTKNLTTEMELDEVTSFFETNTNDGFQQKINQGIDSIKINISSIERDTKDISDLNKWLITTS